MNEYSLLLQQPFFLNYYYTYTLVINSAGVVGVLYESLGWSATD